MRSGGLDLVFLPHLPGRLPSTRRLVRGRRDPWGSKERWAGWLADTPQPPLPPWLLGTQHL